MHTAVSHSISPITAAPLRAWIRRAVLRLRIWTEAYAAAAAEAALYGQLSRLSDAELQRRGLSRATLARDVLGAAERYRSLPS
jgi:hypothetical protein